MLANSCIHTDIIIESALLWYFTGVILPQKPVQSTSNTKSWSRWLKNIGRGIWNFEVFWKVDVKCHVAFLCKSMKILNIIFTNPLVSMRLFFQNFCKMTFWISSIEHINSVFEYHCGISVFALPLNVHVDREVLK